MKFELVNQDDNQATLSLKSDSETLKGYPFTFELSISYQLNGRKLQVAYQVANLDQKDVYFSIGGHPGFNCPHSPCENSSDYQLVFAKKENATIHLKPGKLRSGEIIFPGEAQA